MAPDTAALQVFCCLECGFFCVNIVRPTQIVNSLTVQSLKIFLVINSGNGSHRTEITTPPKTTADFFFKEGDIEECFVPNKFAWISICRLPKVCLCQDPKRLALEAFELETKSFSLSTDQIQLNPSLESPWFPVGNLQVQH